MPRGHSLEFGASAFSSRTWARRAPGALRITSVPRRFCSTSSSSSKHDGAVESDGSGGDDPDEATFDESFAVRDVYDTRPCLRNVSREDLRSSSTRLAWLVANKKMSAEAVAGASEADIARAWHRLRVKLRRNRNVLELRRNRVDLRRNQDRVRATASKSASGSNNGQECVATRTHARADSK